jgi:uncharacterized protein involved in exopolysaccharide biosynthesis
VATGEGGRERDGGAGGGRDYAFRVYAVDDADEVRLKDLWLTIWRGKWIVSFAAIGTAVVAVALTLVITPEYRASVLVAPVTETAGASTLASLASQFAGVAALAGVDLTGSGSRTAEAVATLESRAFTENFIRERKLMPALFADDWDAATGRWRVEAEDRPRMWNAFQRFDSIRELEQDVQTGLITVTVNWTDPTLAATWANGLITDVNQMMRDRAIRESQQNLDFLQTELQTSSQVPLQSTIYSLIEVQMQNSMLANVNQQYAFRVIDPAVVPEKRYWPNRLVFAVLGLFAGLVIGTFWAFLRAPRGAAG